MLSYYLLLLKCTVQHKTLARQNFGEVGTIRKLADKTLVVDHFHMIIFFLVYTLSYLSGNIEDAHIRGFCGELIYLWIPQIQNSVGEPSSWRGAEV